MDVVVAGVHENISAVQATYVDWVAREKDPVVIAKAEHAYMPMLQTAEFVSKKYGVSSEAQDRYSPESQRRTAAAQEAGRLDAEIVPFDATMLVVNREPRSARTHTSGLPATTATGLRRRSKG